RSASRACRCAPATRLAASTRARARLRCAFARPRGADSTARVAEAAAFASADESANASLNASPTPDRPSLRAPAAAPAVVSAGARTAAPAAADDRFAEIATPASTPTPRKPAPNAFEKAPAPALPALDAREDAVRDQSPSNSGRMDTYPRPTRTPPAATAHPRYWPAAGLPKTAASCLAPDP